MKLRNKAPFIQILSCSLGQEDILVRLDTTSDDEDRFWSAARALQTATTKLPEMEESYMSQHADDTKYIGPKTIDDHGPSPHGLDNYDDDFGNDEVSRSATRTVSQFYGGEHT